MLRNRSQNSKSSSFYFRLASSWIPLCTPLPDQGGEGPGGKSYWNWGCLAQRQDT